MDDQDQQGITAYHGSPHDFEQFDISKIGTGEGAQSFGHGLYFAEAEPTAKTYRDALSGRNAYVIDHVMQHAPEMMHIRPDTMSDIRRFSNAEQYDPMTAAKWAQNSNSELRNFDTAKLANVIASHRNAARGHMYEVNINAHPHHFLDWDKPLSEQSEHVQNALTNLFGEKNISSPMTGREIHDEVKNFVRNTKLPSNYTGNVFENTSKILKNSGIKGIRYLDQGSRASVGKPTHNYVVFDHDDVHIKRKYERGGRVGFDIGGAVPETPTLAGVQSFFDQANLVNQQKEAAQSQAAYQQAIDAKAKADADAAAKAAAAKPAEGFGGDISAGGGGGGSDGGGGGGIGGGLGSDFGGAIGGRDSNNADATGAVGSSYGHGGRVDFNTGGPVNVSKAQDTAGNFKKEHEKIHGIPVAIEVKEGHDRVKYKPGGKIKFKAKQYADYGAILGTKDADGMNTDVMVGPHKGSDKAYIIDQQKHDSGKFDEHKVLLGFKKRKKAIKAYTKSYADRHGKERVKDVVKTDIKGLKKWLKYGNLDKPASKDALIKTALSVVSKKT
jgi:hypothetical protein